MASHALGATLGALATLLALALFAAGPAQAHDGTGGHVHLVEARAPCATHCPHTPTGWAEHGPGVGEITLNWTPATTGPAAAFWRVTVEQVGVGTVHRSDLLSASTRSYTVSGLVAGGAHHVLIVGAGVSHLAADGGVGVAQNVYAEAVSADAGADATVRAGARVRLDGTGSGAPTSYAWSQTGGPTVTLDDAASATPAFIAPSVSSSTDLTFSLTVSDGTRSTTDTV